MINVHPEVEALYHIDSLSHETSSHELILHSGRIKNMDVSATLTIGECGLHQDTTHSCYSKELSGYSSRRQFMLWSQAISISMPLAYLGIVKEAEGIKLMEVYNMRYLCYDRVTPEEKCGTISLVSDTGVQYIYKVQNGDMPSINCRDEIVPTVKGPTCSFRNLRMEFDLFNGAYKGTIPLESHSLHDGLLTFHDQRIKSEDHTGEISVLLGFYSSAIIARLEINLLNNSDASESSVYGAVLSTNNKFDLPKYTSVLFFKQSHNKIKLGDDGVIPLSKSRVVVPSCCDELYVDISLHVNDEHYTTTACFDAKSRKPSVHSASHMVVKVNWDVDKESTFDTIFPPDESGLGRLSTHITGVDMGL